MDGQTDTCADETSRIDYIPTIFFQFYTASSHASIQKCINTTQPGLSLSLPALWFYSPATWASLQ